MICFVFISFGKKTPKTADTSLDEYFNIINNNTIINNNILLCCKSPPHLLSVLKVSLTAKAESRPASTACF